MTPKKTPKRKTPNTKRWNVNLNEVPVDESLCFDYEDQGKSQLCGVKLRSNQLDKWFAAHKDAFDNTFESSKETSVTWKSSTGITSMSIQTTSATGKTGKRLLFIHFYHKKQGLMVQGHGTTWWIDNLYPELVNYINSQQTRSSIKHGAQRVTDAIDRFPTIPAEQTTPMQVSTNDVLKTPTLPKCVHPRQLHVTDTPEHSNIEGQVQSALENGAISDGDAAIKNGGQGEGTKEVTDKQRSERLTSMEKCQRISDAAFDDLQKQFVDITDSYNKLQDEWVMKEREREKSHTAMLKDLSTKAEAAQRSLEGHIKKVVTKLQNDLRHAQKDLVLQREELAKERGATVQEMMIERNLWKERNHNLSIKIDDLTASNAKLQHAITTQDAEIEVLVNRLKDLEERSDCKSGKKTTNNTILHDNDVAPQNQHDNTTINTFIVNQNADVNPSSVDNRSIVNQSHIPSSATGVKEPPSSTNMGNSNESHEVRIFADSIFRDVDVKRVFNGKSTKMHRNSTLTTAINCMKHIKDSTTKLVILHIGSNDLDNTKQRNDSVSETLSNTGRLLDATKASFPNAQVAISHVLQRGANYNSTLNVNIKNYNQKVLNNSRDGSFTYIKHRKLNQDRSLYHPDQIHLDHRSGTKLLVSDVKRTLNPASGPGAGRQSPDGTGSQTNRPLVNQRVPKRLQPGPSQAMNPPPHQPYTMKPTPRNTSGGTGQVAIPTLVKDGSNGHPSLHISTPRNTSPVGAGQVSLWKAGKTGHPGQQWKQLGSRLRKVWNILMS
ncbi:Hypp7012 [Branchiostoma lanceolatum]|uniref:Hypp7012 protein n=1 Tax=Branchiostoma lanceolatum TaxID=7740 RepID=A0A8K0E6G0_BRALA|nr:Hypp7012 [Branchiostoma lanceolatum]